MIKKLPEADPHTNFPENHDKHTQKKFGRIPILVKQGH